MKKKPRRSTKKSGVRKLTPRRFRSISASGADVTRSVRAAIHGDDGFLTDEIFMRV